MEAILFVLAILGLIYILVGIVGGEKNNCSKCNDDTH